LGARLPTRTSSASALLLSKPLPAVDADEVFEYGLNLMLAAVVARLS
jgi:hypothetical protein